MPGKRKRDRSGEKEYNEEKAPLELGSLALTRVKIIQKLRRRCAEKSAELEAMQKILEAQDKVIETHKEIFSKICVCIEKLKKEKIPKEQHPLK